MPSASATLNALADLAGDLTSSLAVRDRYERLLNAVRRVVPCDAACLLALEGHELTPLAGYGLTGEAMKTRYARVDHPRLDAIISAKQPVRFPADSQLADPFDGYLTVDPRALRGIHACLGCALRDGDVVVGALTADALEPSAFDQLDDHLLRLLAGLAGAALRTARMIESLEATVDRQAQDLRDRARDMGKQGFLGVSDAAKRVVYEVQVVAATELPVLITGETGVGKELIAGMVHSASPRREQPLVIVNCAALPESLAEAELFGHETGAFTGALRSRAGKFELADHATLFLDEVGELPQSLQPKLLRALQQGEVQRLGSERTRRVSVRVIAATNRNLPVEVELGRFRADLYHRLATYPIAVPPLRERLQDLPILADHLLNVLSRKLGAGELVLAVEGLNLLSSYSWPGNVRELDNVLTRAVLRARAERPRARPVVIARRDLASTLDMPGSSRSAEPAMTGGTQRDLSLAKQMEDFQRGVIESAVQSHDGNWAAAARSLGLHRANLHALAKRLGMK